MSQAGLIESHLRELSAPSVKKQQAALANLLLAIEDPSTCAWLDTATASDILRTPSSAAKPSVTWTRIILDVLEATHTNAKTSAVTTASKYISTLKKLILLANSSSQKNLLGPCAEGVFEHTRTIADERTDVFSACFGDYCGILKSMLASPSYASHLTASQFEYFLRVFTKALAKPDAEVRSSNRLQAADILLLVTQNASRDLQAAERALLCDFLGAYFQKASLEKVPPPLSHLSILVAHRLALEGYFAEFQSLTAIINKSLSRSWTLVRSAHLKRDFLAFLHLQARVYLLEAPRNLGVAASQRFLDICFEVAHKELQALEPASLASQNILRRSVADTDATKSNCSQHLQDLFVDLLHLRLLLDQACSSSSNSSNSNNHSSDGSEAEGSRHTGMRSSSHSSGVLSDADSSSTDGMQRTGKRPRLEIDLTVSASSLSTAAFVLTTTRASPSALWLRIVTAFAAKHLRQPRLLNELLDVTAALGTDPRTAAKQETLEGTLHLANAILVSWQALAQSSAPALSTADCISLPAVKLLCGVVAKRLSVKQSTEASLQLLTTAFALGFVAATDIFPTADDFASMLETVCNGGPTRASLKLLCVYLLCSGVSESVPPSRSQSRSSTLSRNCSPSPLHAQFPCKMRLLAWLLVDGGLTASNLRAAPDKDIPDSLLHAVAIAALCSSNTSGFLSLMLGSLADLPASSWILALPPGSITGAASHTLVDLDVLETLWGSSGISAPAWPSPKAAPSVVTASTQPQLLHFVATALLERLTAAGSSGGLPSDTTALLVDAKPFERYSRPSQKRSLLTSADEFRAQAYWAKLLLVVVFVAELPPAVFSPSGALSLSLACVKERMTRSPSPFAPACAIAFESILGMWLAHPSVGQQLVLVETLRELLSPPKLPSLRSDDALGSRSACLTFLDASPHLGAFWTAFLQQRMPPASLQTLFQLLVSHLRPSAAPFSASLKGGDAFQSPSVNSTAPSSFDGFGDSNDDDDDHEFRTTAQRQGHPGLALDSSLTEPCASQHERCTLELAATCLQLCSIQSCELFSKALEQARSDAMDTDDPGAASMWKALQPHIARLSTPGGALHFSLSAKLEFVRLVCHASGTFWQACALFSSVTRAAKLPSRASASCTRVEGQIHDLLLQQLVLMAHSIASVAAVDVFALVPSVSTLALESLRHIRNAAGLFQLCVLPHQSNRAALDEHIQSALRHCHTSLLIVSPLPQEWSERVDHDTLGLGRIAAPKPSGAKHSGASDSDSNSNSNNNSSDSDSEMAVRQVKFAPRSGKGKRGRVVIDDDSDADVDSESYQPKQRSSSSSSASRMMLDEDEIDTDDEFDRASNPTSSTSLPSSSSSSSSSRRSRDIPVSRLAFPIARRVIDSCSLLVFWEGVTWPESEPGSPSATLPSLLTPMQVLLLSFHSSGNGATRLALAKSIHTLFAPLALSSPLSLKRGHFGALTSLIHSLALPTAVLEIPGLDSCLAACGLAPVANPDTLPSSSQPCSFPAAFSAAVQTLSSSALFSDSFTPAHVALISLLCCSGVWSGGPGAASTASTEVLQTSATPALLALAALKGYTPSSGVSDLVRSCAWTVFRLLLSSGIALGELPFRVLGCSSLLELVANNSELLLTLLVERMDKQGMVELCRLLSTQSGGAVSDSARSSADAHPASERGPSDLLYAQIKECFGGIFPHVLAAYHQSDSSQSSSRRSPTALHFFKDLLSSNLNKLIGKNLNLLLSKLFLLAYDESMVCTDMAGTMPLSVVLPWPSSLLATRSASPVRCVSRALHEHATGEFDLEQYLSAAVGSAAFALVDTHPDRPAPTAPVYSFKDTTAALSQLANATDVKTLGGLLSQHQSRLYAVHAEFVLALESRCLSYVDCQRVFASYVRFLAHVAFPYPEPWFFKETLTLIARMQAKHPLLHLPCVQLLSVVCQARKSFGGMDFAYFLQYAVNTVDQIAALHARVVDLTGAAALSVPDMHAMSLHTFLAHADQHAGPGAWLAGLACHRKRSDLGFARLAGSASGERVAELVASSGSTALLYSQCVLAVCDKVMRLVLQDCAAMVCFLDPFPKQSHMFASQYNEQILSCRSSALVGKCPLLFEMHRFLTLSRLSFHPLNLHLGGLEQLQSMLCECKMELCWIVERQSELGNAVCLLVGELIRFCESPSLDVREKAAKCLEELGAVVDVSALSMGHRQYSSASALERMSCGVLSKVYVDFGKYQARKALENPTLEQQPPQPPQPPSKAHSGRADSIAGGGRLKFPELSRDPWGDFRVWEGSILKYGPLSSSWLATSRPPFEDSKRCFVLLEWLAALLAHPDVQTARAAAQGLRDTLLTRPGLSFYEALGAEKDGPDELGPKNYLLPPFLPFSTAAGSGASSARTGASLASLHERRRAELESRPDALFTSELASPAAWLTTADGFSHAAWVTRLASCLIGTAVKDPILAELRGPCLREPTLSEFLLPALICDALKSSAERESADAALLVSRGVNHFFLHHESQPVHSIRVMLEVVCFVRAAESLELRKMAPVALSQPSSSSQSAPVRLLAPEFPEMMLSAASSFLTQNAGCTKYLLHLDVIQIAKAAQFCGAYVTSLMMLELWCSTREPGAVVSSVAVTPHSPARGGSGAATVKSSVKRTHRDEPVAVVVKRESEDPSSPALPQASVDEEALCQSLLFEAYMHVSDVDGVYGVTNRLDMSCRTRLFEAEGEWDRAMEMYDLQLSSSSSSPSLAFHPSELDAVGEVAPAAAPRANRWLLQGNLLNAMQRHGLTSILHTYMTGLSASEQPASLSEHQFEMAWRIGEWDATLLDASAKAASRSAVNAPLHCLLYNLVAPLSLPQPVLNESSVRLLELQLATRVGNDHHQNLSALQSALVKLGMVLEIGEAFHLHEQLHPLLATHDTGDTLQRSSPSSGADLVHNLSSRWHARLTMSASAASVACFEALEPLLAMRASLLKSLCCVGPLDTTDIAALRTASALQNAFAKHLLQFAGLARKAKRYHTASHALGQLDLIDGGGRMYLCESVLFQAQIEKAKLAWARNETSAAVRAIASCVQSLEHRRSRLSEKGRSRSGSASSLASLTRESSWGGRAVSKAAHVLLGEEPLGNILLLEIKARLLAGNWLAATHSCSPMSILERYMLAASWQVCGSLDGRAPSPAGPNGRQDVSGAVASSSLLHSAQSPLSSLSMSSSAVFFSISPSASMHSHLSVPSSPGGGTGLHPLARAASSSSSLSAAAAAAHHGLSREPTAGATDAAQQAGEADPFAVSQSLHTRRMRMAAKAFARVAQFADAQYQKMQADFKSEEHEASERLAKQTKVDYERLSSVAQVTSEVRRQLLRLSNQLRLDELEAERKKRDLFFYLRLAMHSYIQCLASDANDEYSLFVFRICSLWFENRHDQRINQLMHGTAKTLPTHTYLPLMYQLAARMSGVRNEWEALQSAPAAAPTLTFGAQGSASVERTNTATTQLTPSFQGVLKQIIFLCAVDHPYHVLPIVVALRDAYDDTPESSRKTAEIDESKVEAANDVVDRVRNALATLASSGAQGGMRSAAEEFGPLFEPSMSGQAAPARSGSRRSHPLTSLLGASSRTTLLQTAAEPSSARAPTSVVLENLDTLRREYIRLANQPTPKDKRNHAFLVPNGFLQVREYTPLLTAHIPVRKACDYDDMDESSDGGVVFVDSFAREGKFAGGISAPKIIECRGTDGRRYRQLVKGKDDLRQDAVMQQVFVIVNSLLEKSEASKTRRLRMRTYKVIPLTQRSGLLEWVLNTKPFGEYLVERSSEGQLSAHERYRPGDWKAKVCLEKLKAVATSLLQQEQQHQQQHQQQIASSRQQLKLHSRSSTDFPGSFASSNPKLRCYLEIAENFKPVFRHFFFESFRDPSLWFEKRLSYTRSVAVSSMIGYILGLGDRHIQNILVDQTTAELVQIDFGVAFEQGKFLPTPELVPFRLTRDVVDGMGHSGVEGTFRRCCEETLRVLRANQAVVLTILEVLLYDPMYNWTLSPEKAIEMQQQQDVGGGAEDVGLLAAGKRRATQSGGQVNLFGANPDLSGENGSSEASGAGGAGGSARQQQMEGAKNKQAERVLLRLKQKLQGLEEGVPLSVQGQVNYLIQEATDPEKLALMYYGWQAYV